MVWAGISARVTTKCAFLDDNINVVEHTSVWDDSLLPFLERNYDAEGNWFIFKQDNAALHTENFTKEWVGRR